MEGRPENVFLQITHFHGPWTGCLLACYELVYIVFHDSKYENEVDIEYYDKGNAAVLRGSI